ncbi:GNAT family N-acetyltransferase [Enterococcus sp. N249-2]
MDCGPSRAQRQGAPRQLLYHVLEVCQQSDAPTIYLPIQTWSHHAIALYRYETVHTFPPT